MEATQKGPGRFCGTPPLFTSEEGLPNSLFREPAWTALSVRIATETLWPGCCSQARGRFLAWSARETEMKPNWRVPNLKRMRCMHLFLFLLCAAGATLDAV